jgi:phage terminase large subunit-like protein
VTDIHVPAEQSTWDRLRGLDSDARGRIIDTIPDLDLKDIPFAWDVHQRPSQATPPGLWRVWLILAGRGFGKTRTGAEWVREKVDAGQASHLALIAATAGDARDTMIEGESGLLSVYPKDRRPRYEPSKRRVTFWNGAVATAFSADEPDRLRGPNHDAAWADELAAWRYPDAWEMLQFGLRIGHHPQICATTTPKPTPILKRLIGTDDGSVVVTRGSTYDNRANLADSFLTEITARYGGTRLGQQELFAEMLDDAEGALWSRDMLEAARVSKAPALDRIVVGVDPAISNTSTSDETGIVVVGKGADGHGYVLDDSSLRASPHDWATAAVAAYHRFSADRIVAESNQGGDMVEAVIRTVDPNVPVKLVHASRGKKARAEPVSALYETDPPRVHHVGFFGQLEDQLCEWTGDGDSPDRLDALVWALTETMLGQQGPPAVVPFSATAPSQWTLT